MIIRVKQPIELKIEYKRINFYVTKLLNLGYAFTLITFIPIRLYLGQKFNNNLGAKHDDAKLWSCGLGELYTKSPCQRLVDKRVNLVPKVISV